MRSVSGQIVRADTGKPVAGAHVLFFSGRSRFNLIPADTFGIDAGTTADAQGRFDVTVKLKDQVKVIVQNDEFVQTFTLSAFPFSNRIDHIAWKLSEKKSFPPASESR